MLFAFICTDNDNTLALRKQHRTVHLERLNQLKEKGRLVLAGPHPKTAADSLDQVCFTGSLVVADFDTIADAKSWINDDPYTINGIFKSIEVKPFKQVLP